MYINQTIKNILCQVRDNAAKKDIVATLSCHHEKSHLMRIGNNSVSLNTSEELTRLDLEVINGRKQGTHTQMGNITSIEYVEKALQVAIDKAAMSKPNDYDPIISVVEKTLTQSDQYDEELENIDPEFKADSYKQIFDKLGDQYNFSGSWSSGSTELFLTTTANTNEMYHKCTDQLFNIVLKHPKKYWELSETQTGWKKSDFSADIAIKELKKYLTIYENHDGYQVKPDNYTVAFGPQAIAEVLRMAVWTGCFGRTYEEKRGWTANNKLGDKILGDNIIVNDDPENTYTFKFKFDMSGKLRKTFPLIKNGLLSNLMYDSVTAAKYKKEPTGHDINGSSMVLATGSGTEDIFEELKNYDKVLYIPALHYLNLPNISKGIFTGSSRFNALLLEKGKIISPILSSRITDTFQNVFGNLTSISEKAVSINLSNTYGRRSPVACSVPSYIVSEGVKITDCADSF
jgi:predicted Zn-dependent protease